MKESKEHNYYVYIMTNKINTVLYVGVTDNLIRRVYEHKTKVIKGFTEKYNINKLVYFETTKDVNFAIAREKVLKRWKRDWKVALIEENNKEWNDLYNSVIK